MQGSVINWMSRWDFISPRRRLEWYPPFWWMRIRVLELDEHWDRVRILLPLNWLSANAAGNMFGGYQACLADPVPALACLHKFPGHRIATRALELDFFRVGSTDLTLHFDFPADLEQDIRDQLEKSGRATPTFEMRYVRADGEACTRIRNTVAIRPKGWKGEEPA